MEALGHTTIWRGGERTRARDIGVVAPLHLASGRAINTGNCAAYFEENLAGQKNWQSPRPVGRMSAPPHAETGHTWHHADDLLFGDTKMGGTEDVPTGWAENSQINP